MFLLGLSCALSGENPFFLFKIPEGAQTTTMLVKLKLIILRVHVFYFTSEFVTFNSQPSDLGILLLA